MRGRGLLQASEEEEEEEGEPGQDHLTTGAQTEPISGSGSDIRVFKGRSEPRVKKFLFMQNLRILLEIISD